MKCCILSNSGSRDAQQRLFVIYHKNAHRFEVCHLLHPSFPLYSRRSITVQVMWSSLTGMSLQRKTDMILLYAMVREEAAPWLCVCMSSAFMGQEVCAHALGHLNVQFECRGELISQTPSHVELKAFVCSWERCFSQCSAPNHVVQMS